MLFRLESPRLGELTINPNDVCFLLVRSYFSLTSFYFYYATYTLHTPVGAKGHICYNSGFHNHDFNEVVIGPLTNLPPLTTHDAGHVAHGL